MIKLEVDQFKFKRSNQWDLLKDPLNQYDIIPIDTLPISGTLHQHGQISHLKNIIAKIGSNAVWLPINADEGLKIFNNSNDRKIAQYCEVIFAAKDLAPRLLGIDLVQYNDRLYWSILQKRLTNSGDFQKDFFDLYGIQGVEYSIPSSWGDDALPLFLYIKHAGKYQDLAIEKTKKMLIDIRNKLEERGLVSKFHEDKEDYGDVTAFNVLWSNGQLWMVDFDSWAVF